MKYYNINVSVMEVACGEHGDYMEKLVAAVDAGDCNIYNIKTPEATPAITKDVIKGFSLQRTSPQVPTQSTPGIILLILCIDSSF